MRRKVARSSCNGSYVTEASSLSNVSLVSIQHETDTTDNESTFSELDDELRERLNKLKINLGIERQPLAESNKVNNHQLV